MARRLSRLLECSQMNMHKFPFLVVCVSSLLWIGCSEPPKPAAQKEPEKPAEPVSGQSALFKMYQVARASWSGDSQVLKLNDIHLTDVPAPIGKAGAWQATFVSSSKGKAKTYTFSVIEQEGNLHKGVYGTGEESWSGSQGVNSPFDIRAVSIDSGAAYKTADEHAADVDKKSPGMPISFLLEKTNQFPDPVWRVIWGESVGTSSFSVYVDAGTGNFLIKMH